MKPKLKVFEDFSKALLPHEAKYLQNLGNFQEEEKQQIFQILIHNALQPEQEINFNIEFDKRKYHHIKTWAEKKLQFQDVDLVAEWLLDLSKKLALDLITSEEEKTLIAYLKNYKNITFNFQIFYQLMRDYRSYLLIRMRYDDHIIVSEFLENYKKIDERAKEIEGKLYQATIEITDQFTKTSETSIYWEKWLKKVFEAENINGNNRYKAFILLAFMYNTTGNLKQLQTIFDQIDEFFSQGKLYCRRLLYNYYSSRVLLHSKQRNYETAIYYGKLSIRQRNEDTLMYVNNLVSIYLRLQQYKEALALLESYNSIYEKTHNSLQRLIYISYNLRALNELNLSKKAENIGIYFLQKYESEIFKLRWHHFFTSYLNVLFKNENYAAILNLEKKFGLKALEIGRRKSSDYVPNLSWLITTASFLENKISKEQFMEILKDSLASVTRNDNNSFLLQENADLLAKNLPELKILFKSYLT